MGFSDSIFSTIDFFVLSASAIFLRLCPCCFKARIFSFSQKATDTLGLPIFFPSFLALAIQAFTLSLMISLSNCAKALIIVNISCQPGVDVSICSL
jgi:hypothetical protein